MSSFIPNEELEDTLNDNNQFELTETEGRVREIC